MGAAAGCAEDGEGAVCATAGAAGASGAGAGGAVFAATA